MAQRKLMQLTETFDDLASVSYAEPDLSITESISPEGIDGKYIIGIIEGQFFQPDGMSRNKRFYPAELWENALDSADVKNRIATRTMFGEIGHSEGPVEDMTLRQGCASHFIESLWITPDGKGMGRAYILNTPTGQLLKTYLGAGCQLKVSSRGEGLYSESHQKDGCPVIDPVSYILRTFDFVLSPGFLQTSAVLREAYENAVREVNNKSSEYKEWLPKLTKNRKIITEQQKGEKQMSEIDEAFVQHLKAETNDFKSEVKALREQLDSKNSEIATVKASEAQKIATLTEELETFKKMGLSPEAISESFNKAKVALKEAKAANVKLTEELNSYKEFGSKEDLQEATELSKRTIAIVQGYQKTVGTLSEAAKLKEAAVRALPKLKSLKEEVAKVKTDKATLEEAAKKAVVKLEESKQLEAVARKAVARLKEAKQLEAVATKAASILEAYKAEGTVEEFRQLKELAKKFVESKAPKTSDVDLSKVKAVSEELKVTVEEAAKLIKENKVEERRAALKAVSESKPLINANSSKELVESESKLDKAPEQKDAKSYLTQGMIINKFNPKALGKKIGPTKFEELKAKNLEKAKALFDSKVDKFETDKAADAKVKQALK